MSDTITPLTPAPAPTAAPAAPASTPASPAPAPAATVDAVLVSHTYPESFSEVQKLQRRNAEFAPILWAGQSTKGLVEPNSPKRVWSREVRDIQMDLIVRTNDGVESYRFPDNHPHQPGRERHTWTDRGDGVLYGVLVPEVPSA